jgi:small GTP-binding protein
MSSKHTNIKSYDYDSKILLIGDSSVGKTSLMMRFINNKFCSSYITTIGIDFVTKIIEIDENKIRLQIWDTAGLERFRSITTSYFKGANIIIIIYDVCDETTFENVEYWMKTAQNSKCDYTGAILVGNKIDMTTTRKISYKDGFDLAKKYNIPFFECSAKKGINVDSIFKEAGKIYVSTFNSEIKSQVQTQTKSQVQTNHSHGDFDKKSFNSTIDLDIRKESNCCS